MDKVDFLLLVLIVAAVISVVAAVVSVYSSRRSANDELQADVESLAITVERLATNSRREKMARVRQARTDLAQTGNAGDSGGPPVVGQLNLPSDTRAVKAAIRAKLRGVPVP